MSVINQELEALLLKYQTQSDLFASQIEELKAKKIEVDAIVKQFQKMIGITPARIHIATNIHRKLEFVDVSVTNAVISVLRVKDGQTRAQIAEAIALPNSDSIKFITNSLFNADRMAAFHDHFNYEKQEVPDRGAIKLKKIFWLRENIKAEASIGNQPIAEIAKSKQPDIFAGMGDFTKRSVEKHYPNKAVAKV